MGLNPSDLTAFFGICSDLRSKGCRIVFYSVLRCFGSLKGSRHGVRRTRLVLNHLNLVTALSLIHTPQVGWPTQNHKNPRFRLRKTFQIFRISQFFGCITRGDFNRANSVADFTFSESCTFSSFPGCSNGLKSQTVSLQIPQRTGLFAVLLAISAHYNYDNRFRTKLKRFKSKQNLALAKKVFGGNRLRWETNYLLL